MDGHLLIAIFALASPIIWLVGAIWITIRAIADARTDAEKRRWIRNKFFLIGLCWALIVPASIAASHLVISMGDCTDDYDIWNTCARIPDIFGEFFHVFKGSFIFIRIVVFPFFLAALACCEVVKRIVQSGTRIW